MVARWLLALVPVLVFSGLAAPAPAADMAPGGFGEHEARFIDSIKFPPGGDVDVTVSCDGYIYKNGRLRTVFCDHEEEHPTFHRAIVGERSHRLLRARAAKVRGRKQDIWFQYAVRFQRKDGRETITVQPHDGSSTPQRYRAPRSVRYNKTCPFDYSARIAVSIAADGAPGAVSIHDGELTPECFEGIASFVRKSKYIPAFADHIPKESTLIERFSRAANSF